MITTREATRLVLWYATAWGDGVKLRERASRVSDRARQTVPHHSFFDSRRMWDVSDVIRTVKATVRTGVKESIEGGPHG